MDKKVITILQEFICLTGPMIVFENTLHQVIFIFEFFWDINEVKWKQYLFRNNWAVTHDFQQYDILIIVDQTSLCSFLLSLETPNDLQSVASHS